MPEHKISMALYYLRRDRFLEAGQRGLINGSSVDKAKVLRARAEKLEKLEKIIGR